MTITSKPRLPLGARSRSSSEPDFDAALAQRRLPLLVRAQVTTLQINLGKRCNMACHHCHVEAGPKRTESMSTATVDRVLSLLARSHAVTVVDLTGGAPELHPSFRSVVDECRRIGKQVIDRCNLTVLLEPGMEGTAELLAEQRVERRRLVYRATGARTSTSSAARAPTIEASPRLRLLNQLGYGTASGARRSTWSTTPVAPSYRHRSASFRPTTNASCASSSASVSTHS